MSDWLVWGRTLTIKEVSLIVLPYQLDEKKRKHYRDKRSR